MSDLNLGFDINEEIDDFFNDKEDSEQKLKEFIEFKSECKYFTKEIKFGEPILKKKPKIKIISNKNNKKVKNGLF